MFINKDRLASILKELEPYGAALVAVSKMKPAEAIREAYNSGQKIFGENYVQELVDKHEKLPNDIEWHFIGHLQTNKVKFIAPFVSLVHGVDSLKLLKEIAKEAKKNDRIINCLLQVHIATEETKFGLSFEEVKDFLKSPDLVQLKNICVKGLMGMATLTDDAEKIRSEFKELNSFFNEVKNYPLPTVDCRLLSMGMTSDYKIALEEGSNMVRIGSAIFGERS